MPGRSYLHFIIAIVILVGVSYLFSSFTLSQESRNNERIDFLKNQIHQIESQLSDYKNNKESFITLIQARQGLIKNRTDLINRLNEEINHNSAELQKLEDNNKSSLKLLEVYKKDFEFVARKKFTQQLNQSHMFSVNQKEWNAIVKKLIWTEQLNEFRINRFKVYKNSLDSVLARKNEIKNKIQSQKEMVLTQESEKTKITGDINQLHSDYKEIQSKIKEYKSILDKYNRERAQLENMVNQSITENVRTEITYTPSTKIAWSFPLSGGTISSPYGTFRDPKNPQLTLKNNGIDIRAKESFVRSAVEATVIQIRQMDNGTFFLLTQSGEYYQVYSNLDKVFVKPGERVDKLSNLGELKTESNGMHNLHFEVWKGRTPIDPIGFVGR